MQVPYGQSIKKKISVCMIFPREFFPNFVRLFLSPLLGYLNYEQHGKKAI
jgi:hypothetical protein